MWKKAVTTSMILLPVIMVFGNSPFIPVLSNIQQSLHLSYEETGLILSVFSIPAALIIPFLGFLSDRFTRKQVILSSLVLLMIGSIISFSYSYFPKSWMFSILLVGRFIQGLGAGGTAPLAIALIGDVFQQSERAKKLGVLEAWNGISKIVAPVVGASIALLSWDYLFLVLFLLSLIAFIGIRCMVPLKGNDSNMTFQQYGHAIKRLFFQKAKHFVALFLLGGNALLIVFGVLFFLSYYIEEVFQIDGFFKGFTFLFPLGAMALSSYWTGKEIKKRQERWKQYLILGVAMKVGAFIGTIIFFNFSFCLFFITIAFAGIGFLLPAVNYGITSAADESDRGFIVSLYGATRFLGVALGPIIFGWVPFNQTIFGFSLMLSLLSFVFLLIGNYSVIRPKLFSFKKYLP